MDKKIQTAIRNAIKKYWQEKTDDQLAQGLRTTPDVIRKMRLEMNLKGTESLKDFSRRYLLEMTDPEKKEFMRQLSAETIFKMAEGSPATSGDININTEPVRIDITHQLIKVYGPDSARIIDSVPSNSEGSQLPAGSSK